MITNDAGFRLMLNNVNWFKRIFKKLLDKKNWRNMIIITGAIQLIIYEWNTRLKIANTFERLNKIYPQSINYDEKRNAEKPSSTLTTE